ncbi:four-helix bundle copper-binding protein [Streptomyces sp. NPDC058045]|uniref:four-helix bundle copper-binding protein n=1 Tax=Streptomyces sp. NPDC058045 TaxID=3346311 RepID=UPI0036F06FB1
MTSTAGEADRDRQDLVTFLEEAFGCAQACADCARSCAGRISAGRISFTGTHDGPAPQDLRRQSVLCTEVCDATCAMLSEQAHHDEYALRIQVEWTRAMCLECAHICDRYAGSEECARVCRACARACTSFLTVLTPA